MTGYKLFASKNAEAAENERYHYICPKYALTLAESAPKGMIEIKPEEYHRLDENERKWLVECLKDIYEDILKAKQEEMEKAQKAFLKELTVELEKEKQLLEKGAAHE